MAPIFKFATSSGSKMKEPIYVCQKKYLKVPGKGSSTQVPPTGPLYREMLLLQSQWFIHPFIPVGAPKKEASQKMQEKHTVSVHGAPRRRKAYIQWGAAWFPKRIVNYTAITTPVSCTLQHDTFHLDLGRPEPR
jgi:hypothetical protein